VLLWCHRVNVITTYCLYYLYWCNVCEWWSTWCLVVYSFLCLIACYSPTMYVIYSSTTGYQSPGSTAFVIPNPTKSGPSRIWKKSNLVQPYNTKMHQIRWVSVLHPRPHCGSSWCFPCPQIVSPPIPLSIGNFGTSTFCPSANYFCFHAPVNSVFIQTTGLIVINMSHHHYPCEPMSPSTVSAISH